MADPNHNTLSHFRYKKVFRADDGESGGKKDMHGADAQACTLHVPVGTLIKDSKGSILYDLSTPHTSLRVCRGGR